MSADLEFEKWRKSTTRSSWGLAWYLAFQVCRRFYRSHGIKPVVIAREGLGYYGIALMEIECPVRHREKTLGRFTILGNVENWLTGDPGDHGLKLEELPSSNTSTSSLINQALRHLDIPVRPDKSHVNCRHHRWADSYIFLFEVMTILALRTGKETLTIWNGDWEQEWCRKQDRLADMSQHPGYFEIDPGWTSEPRIVVSGDGRLLDGSERNLWDEYMGGKTALKIAKELENKINELERFDLQ